jgi:hypothetical protein
MLGVGDDTKGFMGYTIAVNSQFDGEANITQLARVECVRDSAPGLYQNWTTDGRYDLDTSLFYFSTHSMVVGDGRNSGMDAFVDSPGYQRGWSQTTAEMQFQDYIRFRPYGEDSIWVTLGRVDWSWAGSESSATGRTPTGTVSGPTLMESHSFPVWSATVSGTGSGSDD